MKSIEIPSEDWAGFCEDFTRINRGSLLSIELLERNGGRIPIAYNMPLEQMRLDQSDQCMDVISISLSEPGKRAIDHLIIDPVHLILRVSESRKKVLELDAENGTTLMTFHSGVLPEVVTTGHVSAKYHPAPDKGKYL